MKLEVETLNTYFNNRIIDTLDGLLRNKLNSLGFEELNELMSNSSNQTLEFIEDTCMSSYNTILLAIDLSDESEKVIEPAKRFITAFDSKVHVLHTIEPFAFAFGGDIPFDVIEIQDQLIDHAKQNLKKLIEKTELETVEMDVVVGSVNSEVHRKAKEIGADLVIVGSHGRHGLALLLGSHASDVIHHAEYDVLAVRI